jgi:hypothetical protein
VQITQADEEWGRQGQPDGVKLDAAYSRFKERWSKDPTRRKRKVPGRTQFAKRIWHRAE